MGEKVKTKVTTVEDFNRMTPAELAAAANDALRSADDFKEALKARGNQVNCDSSVCTRALCVLIAIALQVSNAKAKKALADGAALIAKRNDELAAVRGVVCVRARARVCVRV
jgi:hypothetical protein